MAFQFKAVGQGQTGSADNSPLGRAVEELAKDLGLHPVTSPDLAKALRHFVTCVHPTVGQGGMLLFDLVAVISRAVLDRSVERYGQVNLEDLAVIAGGSPVRLLNFYRTKLPNQQFNQDVTLEGVKGSTASAAENDALWLANNDQFEKQHLVARNFCTDASITVRAYASPLLQNTVAPQDFFEKTRVQGGGEALFGNAVLGRMSLQERESQTAEQS